MNTKKKVKFKVPNYGAKKRKGVKARWRHQRGIDNHLRVMRKGYGEIPKIGYKNPESIRHRGADGMIRILVHDQNELVKAMQVPEVSIVLSGRLSSRKKLMLQKDAESRGVKVANRVKT
jgi:ribosomal protein L32E